MNPVQQTIRDHIDAHLDEWRSRSDAPTPTRSGLRYLGLHVAALLAPPLRASGLHVVEEIEVRLFVTASGRQITRAALSALIAGALDGHPDEILRASIGSASFWSYLADRMPSYEGEEIERPHRARTSTKTSADYAREHRARRDEAEVESSRAFLAAVLPRIAGTRISSTDLYAAAEANIARKAGEAISSDEDSDFWTVPRRRLFYRIADEVLGARVRAARGYVYVVRALGRRLSALAATALRRTGVLDPEAYADAAIADVRRFAPETSPETLDPRAVALPYQVAYAIAGVADEDVVRTFGLMARFHLDRHPEDRPAVVAVAVALKAGDPDGLIDQIRARCSRALAEEAGG